MYRVALIERRSLLRTGLRLIVERSPDICLVGEVSDYDAAPGVIVGRTAHAAIVGASGATTVSWSSIIERVNLASPEARVGFLILGEELPGPPEGFAGELPNEVLHLPVTASAEQLMFALRALVTNTGEARPVVVENETRRVVPVSPLTTREIQVLRAIGEGEQTNEIAHDLGITRKTVETHRTSLMRKLGLHRLADVVRYAISIGLVDCFHSPADLTGRVAATDGAAPAAGPDELEEMSL
jgi:DNA-binding NarL/FixJ family response regulator